MGPRSRLTRGARRRSGVSLHQEGDGGGGAGKERYCLVMSGLCHVNTIDLDRQQNQWRRGVSAHRWRRIVNIKYQSMYIYTTSLNPPSHAKFILTIYTLHTVCFYAVLMPSVTNCIVNNHDNEIKDIIGCVQNCCLCLFVCLFIDILPYVHS